MASVIWSERSRDFLRTALTPLYRDFDLIGEKWLQKIYMATDRLELFPEIGAPMQEEGFSTCRELVVGPFRIIYRIVGSECHIGAVIRAERDLRRAVSPDELL